MNTIREIRIAALGLIATFMIASAAQAQSQTREPAPRIALKLETSHQFTYRYTLATSVRRHLPGVDVVDPYDRTLTYFLSFIVQKVGTDGIVELDVNADSMRISSKTGATELEFDSQRYLEEDDPNIRFDQPEMIGTTGILNKPFHARMTADGDFIDASGLENWFQLIDTNITDPDKRYANEEFMLGDVLRELSSLTGGIQLGRRFVDAEEWSGAAPALLALMPVRDSLHYSIAIPQNRKWITITGAGTVAPVAEQVRRRGFPGTVHLDSLRGTTADTLVLDSRSAVERRAARRQCRAAYHAGNLAFTEEIIESTELKLLSHRRP